MFLLVFLKNYYQNTFTAKGRFDCQPTGVTTQVKATGVTTQVKPKGVTTHMKALNEYILMVLFVLVLTRVHFLVNTT